MTIDETERPPEVEAEILVGGMTREEFLGEPEQITFVQPRRSISKKKRSLKPPVEESD
jgi:hypothetical protein